MVIMERQKTVVDYVNQNIIEAQIQNILESIRLILTNTYKGEMIHYLGNIYTSFIVLEDFYPNLYENCQKELGIDYKKLAEMSRFFGLRIPSSQRQHIESAFIMKIKNVVEKLSLVENFIKDKFLK